MHIKDIKCNYQALHFIQNPAWLRMSSSSISIRPPLESVQHHSIAYRIDGAVYFPLIALLYFLFILP